MIKILDNALLRLRELRDKHNKKFVRLQVKGGGCAGFNYDWSFADEETRNDVVVDDILLIDRINELYLTGMELDYNYDDFESAFVFNNPHAKSSCGCGTSFSV
jgi:iron-sulfur cluster insertion protein|tara:strand:- start:217 stop:525 length:309 start_codon:yes stop_codon:yes gene_type:complete